MFDTLKYSRMLEATGLSREQAEVHVRLMIEITEDNLATKQDIKDIEAKLVQMEYRMVIKVTAIFVTTVTFAITVVAFLLKV